MYVALSDKAVSATPTSEVWRELILTWYVRHTFKVTARWLPCRTAMSPGIIHPQNLPPKLYSSTSMVWHAYRMLTEEGMCLYTP